MKKRVDEMKLHFDTLFETPPIWLVEALFELFGDGEDQPQCDEEPGLGFI
jgi:hypothetical protein